MANRFTKKSVELPKTKKDEVTYGKRTANQTKKIFNAKPTQAEQGNKWTFGGGK